jgi:hypothetical protein
MDFRDYSNQPAQLVDVTTSADTVVELPPESELTIAPVGLQADGLTDNADGDYLAVMFGDDTMAANMTAGRKIVIWCDAGNSKVDPRAVKHTRATASYLSSTKASVVRIRAVGHSAKVQLICNPV